MPRKLRSPQSPTQEEIDEHCLTHLPFRSWCRHCVKAKGRVVDHKSQDREDGLAEIHLDYCFLSSETGINLTVSVLKERSTRMVMSSVVPMKGASDDWAVKRVLAFIKELGLEAVSLVLT